MKRHYSGCAYAMAVMMMAAATMASAAETVGTITLDALSHISFENREVLPIKPGSILRFRFGDAASNGSIPFTISPADVSIEPIPSPDGVGTIHYALASEASGWIHPTASGHRMEFVATVAVNIAGREGAGNTFTYILPFTTESVSATSADGTGSVSRAGMRLVDGIWYVNLVAATVNKTNAYPEPGAAVYAELSGVFDTVPIGE